ncbi:MAG: M23 family metallopeptidase [Patescibacteria group bacterium]|nr:M23 family metallopeptidase [Patescibacteria group bacterium]
MNKLDWLPLKNNLPAFIFHQKFVHVIVIVITITLIFSNLTTDIKAEDINGKNKKTILHELIKSEFGEFEEDEQLVIETFDQEAIISNIQQSYLDNLSSVKAQPRISIGADDEEQIENEVASTIQNGASIVRPNIAATEIAKRARTKTVVYTVRPGDTISTIASEFEISVSTILWENNLSAYSIIRPGDKLNILPMSGITHAVTSGQNISSIAKKYDIEKEKILTANSLAAQSTLQIDQKLLIPNGRKITYSSYTPTTYSGISAIKKIVKSPNAAPAPGNKMNWPTEGSRITQYYSWRHHGLDIANKNGTPIYAADAGTIEMLGWGTGYGNQIIINHGGGKKTRYAHLSKFYVKKGQKVGKGETIAAMGSTGWSTGPHLHFEVIINGVKYNPLNYIK